MTIKKIWTNTLSALLISVLCLAAITTQADVSVVYYHNDALGSPVAATDEAGEVLWREDYAPYGEKLGDEMEAVTETVGYTGHRYDSDTGLTYAGARMYDPSLGRFMGIDPVGALEGVVGLNNSVMFNRYAYANNNPYKYVDPNGESPDKIIGGIILGVVSVCAKNKACRKSVDKFLKQQRLKQNKKKGDEFEKTEVDKAKKDSNNSDVSEQVTVRTEDGTKTRLDIIHRDKNSNIVCTECKSSPTAPLTKNQTRSFPQIEKSGATVVGKGKPGFPGGTKIPSTKVRVVRPEK